MTLRKGDIGRGAQSGLPILALEKEGQGVIHVRYIDARICQPNIRYIPRDQNIESHQFRVVIKRPKA